MSAQHNYIDERAHQPASYYLYIIGALIGLFIGCGVIVFWKLYNSEKRSFLNEESERVDQFQTSVDISENGSNI